MTCIICTLVALTTGVRRDEAGRSLRGHLIMFDFHGPIDTLAEYVIKCLKTPLDYTLSCNFGLDTAQTTKESITEYITFLSHMGEMD